MSLTTRQRIGAYFIGFGIGCVLVAIIFTIRGLPHSAQAEPPPPGVIRREVPGVLGQMMQAGQPIAGDFVLSLEDSRKSGKIDPDTGRFSRAIVVAGLDPGAFIRVEEQSLLKAPDAVVDWKFMFADRARAQLKPDADTKALAEAMAPLGWHYLGGKGQDGWMTISLKDHAAGSVPQAVAQLQEWTQWVAAAEPDYLPMPSATAGTRP